LQSVEHYEDVSDNLQAVHVVRTRDVLYSLR
jgi:hypothetical protein